MKRRCDRNRKRSKKRAIYCPIHGCYLDSVSQKYKVFAEQPSHLQELDIDRQNAPILVPTRTTVLMGKEWLEAFWCEECQQTKWYRIRKTDTLTYEVLPAT